MSTGRRVAVVLCITLVLGLLAFVGLPRLPSPEREEALQAVSEERVLAIRIACGAYGQSHDGEWPSDLSALVEAGEIGREELFVPEGRGSGGRYVYLRPPPEAEIDWGRIIVHEPFTDWPRRGVVAVLRDGRVLAIAEEEAFERLLPDG